MEAEVTPESFFFANLVDILRSGHYTGAIYIAIAEGHIVGAQLVHRDASGKHTTLEIPIDQLAMPEEHTVQ